MSQPDYKFIINIGDKTPLEYGGCFVFRDATGVYPPEVEILEVPENEVRPDAKKYIVRRFQLEPCTFTDGILSDNKFHPLHPAWFAKPETERASRPQDTTYLKGVADYCGMTEGELVAAFCADNSDTGIIQRAQAWRVVGEYHGFENLDSNPLYLTRTEAEQRILDYKK